MKMRTCWALVSLAAFFFGTPAVSNAAVNFSAGIQIGAVSDFYDPLQSYGQWINVGSYGRCWHPTVTLEAGWRPYSVGDWEWTDCGWYWNSDEPWAWACYHYGYWVEDPQYGWVWIPGTEWAPAWVVWRESADYIGWAPCGPGGAVVSPSLFCFVDIHHFHGAIRPGELIFNNPTIVQRTRVIRGINRETRNFDGRRERVVVNRGPAIKDIQRVTGRGFTARPIRDVVRSTPLPQPILQRAQPWRRENARTIQAQPQYQRNRQTEPGRTGREQERNYQQRSTPSRTAPGTREEQRNNNLSPSGREQQRNFERQQPSSTLTPQPSKPSTPSLEQRNQSLSPSGREQQRTYGRQQPSPKVTPQPSTPTRTYTPPESKSQTRPSGTSRERNQPQTLTPSGREQPRVYQQPSESHSTAPAHRETPAQTRSAPEVREAPPTTRAPERAAPAAPREERVAPGRESAAPPAESHAAPDRGRDKDKDK